MNHSDLLAIQLAIAAEPGEQRHRDAYRDRLQELADEAEWVMCPKCEGSKTHFGPVGLFEDNESGWTDCPTCDATGEVRDTTATDRLAFVEIGQELPTNVNDYNPKCVRPRNKHYVTVKYGDHVACVDCWKPLQEEESTIRTRWEATWRTCGRCVVCGGRGRYHSYRIDITEECKVCHGTGAVCWPLALTTRDFVPDGIREHQPETSLITLTWTRGFISGVTTTTANFLRPGVAGTIAHWWPIESVILSDKRPAVSRVGLSGKLRYSWYGPIHDSDNGDESRLPRVLWYVLPHVDYDSDALAMEALALIALGYARAEAKRLFPVPV